MLPSLISIISLRGQGLRDNLDILRDFRLLAVHGETAKSTREALFRVLWIIFYCFYNQIIKRKNEYDEFNILCIMMDFKEQRTKTRNTLATRWDHNFCTAIIASIHNFYSAYISIQKVKKIHIIYFTLFFATSALWEKNTFKRPLKLGKYICLLSHSEPSLITDFLQFFLIWEFQ